MVLQRACCYCVLTAASLTARLLLDLALGVVDNSEVLSCAVELGLSRADLGLSLAGLGLSCVDLGLIDLGLSCADLGLSILDFLKLLLDCQKLIQRCGCEMPSGGSATNAMQIQCEVMARTKRGA